MESSQSEGAAISIDDGEEFAGAAGAFVLLPFPFLLASPEGLAPLLQFLPFFTGASWTATGDGGQPPASKASIEALRTVGAGEEGLDEDCAICLEGLREMESTVVKEVPCGHRFHGVCVERWFKMHGSCPICRFQMPAAAEEEPKKGGDVGVGGGGDTERVVIVVIERGVRNLQQQQQQQQQSVQVSTDVQWQGGEEYDGAMED